MTYDSRNDPEWMEFCQALGQGDFPRMLELEEKWDRERQKQGFLPMSIEEKNKSIQERNARIYNMRKRGLTFLQIGEKVGMSGSTAHKIYHTVDGEEMDRRNKFGPQVWVQ